MNYEIPMIGAGLVSMAGVAAVGWAIDSLLRPAGAHRARPRAQWVPAAVAPETIVPAETAYARFHDRPLAVGPATIAVAWDHCTECTARRYGRALTDGSFLCPDGHRTITEDHR